MSYLGFFEERDWRARLRYSINADRLRKLELIYYGATPCIEVTRKARYKH
jgi:hypothetical protein